MTHAKSMTARTATAAHTPDRWAHSYIERGPLEIGGHWVITDEWNVTVAVVDTGEKAARLIAAAPELLAALQLMQAALTEYGLRDVKKRYSLCVADAAASKAIARAEGRQP